MSQSLNVGIAGLGTVGSSVVRLLERRANALALATGRSIRIAGVSARSKVRHLELAHRYRWFDNAVDLAVCPEIDVFVEAIGGRDGVAFESINRALDSGKAVVTANKALLANHGMLLAKKAEDRNLVLNFEAVVAGGIPIIKQLREAMVGNTIEKIYGILNGTCNYILTEMAERRLSFEAALQAAKQRGYAEADPRYDIEGIDTAHKLAVLATLAFGIKLNPERVPYEGISGISLTDIDEARDLGFAIKLLGIAERREGGVSLRVHPALVPLEAPLAQVNGVLNAISIKADAVDLTTIGPGAGGEATASAVVADIADIARGHGLKNPLLRRTDKLEDFNVSSLSEHRGAFYVSLLVEDRLGVLAAIASAMAEHGISFESLKQIGRRNRLRKQHDEVLDAVGYQKVELITHEASEKSIEAALATILEQKFIHGVPKVLRIEQ